MAARRARGRAPAAGPAPFVVERRLDLDASDLLFATFRPRPPPPPAAPPRPFDPAAIARAVAGRRGAGDDARLDLPALTRAEARCWLEVLCIPPRGRAAGLAALVGAGAAALDDPLEREAVRARLAAAPSTAATPWLVHVLAHLLPPDDVLALALDPAVAGIYALGAEALAEGARRFLLPRLDAAALARLRELARGALAAARWPLAGGTGVAAPAFSVAPLLALHAELRALVEGWEDDRFAAAPHGRANLLAAFRVVLGLESPDEVERHARRLGLRPLTPEAVRGWLATTGAAALDVPAGAVAAATTKAEATALADALALAVVPEAAPVLLGLRASKAGPAATAWLDAHPGTAAAGLLAAATGRGALAVAALEHLRGLARVHPAEVRALVEAAPADAAPRLRAALLEQAPAPPPLDDTPAWLRAPGLRPAPLPGGAPAASLPPLVADGQALTPAHLEVVLAALRATATTDARHPVVEAARARCTPASRDAFAWALFERWLAAGAAPRERWAFLALGHLGTDASALRLAPLVRAWPGQRQHARAVVGLEVLRRLGTDTALMELAAIARRVRFKGLRQRAEELLAALATARGLSPEQLEDRVVPTCDLDAQGTRTLDLGPRRVRLVLGPGLEPLLRDEAGALRATLPRPGAKDDPARAAEALAAWRLLRKQVKEVARVQAARLERAMVDGRRWPRDEHLALLVRHPLLGRLARLLVWAGHDVRGARAATFRVLEDGTFADVHDAPAALDGVTAVSLVHPLHLTPAERAAWSQALADDGLIPPFPQLGRPVHALAPDERAATELRRLDGLRLPPLALLGALEKAGWTRGDPRDGGLLVEHRRPFPGADVTAVLVTDGVPAAGARDAPDVAVERVLFVAGTDLPRALDPARLVGLPLGAVDPVAVSEVLGACEALAARAR